MNSEITPDFIERLKHADIIWAVDVESDHAALVFGRSTLEGIIASRQEMSCSVFTERIVFGSEELEKFLAAVVVAKGYHEYPDSTTIAN